MDINCTHSCAYQHEGKCTLRAIPSHTQSTYSQTEIDCPYFSTGYAQPVA